MADLIKRQQSRPVSHSIHASRESKIVDQVEFYFSDSNLRRDKYMHKLFSDDPYGWISLEALCSFPLLRAQRVTPDELLHFLKRRSDFFIIDYRERRIRRDFERYPNEEIQDQLARRSTDPPECPSVIDKRSIYIENLPLNFSYEDLKNEITSQFSRTLPDVVKYVSIPRHPTTGESFGCAFVEVESEETAALLCKKLRRVETEKFNAVSGKLGRVIRVLSVPKYRILKQMYMRHKSLAPVNRLYHHGADEDPPSTSVHSGSESSESSILVDSDVNSLAQDSVEVRRARNASSIRSNSIIHLSDLPPTNSINLRVWLSHSAAVQFLDHKDNAPEAYARFASRRERDFFIKDFEMSKLKLRGVLPVIRVLSDDECMDYFDRERERRRAQCLSMGPPDLWESSKPKRQRTETAKVGTTLRVVEDVGKLHCASSGFTDTIAGNSNLGEPGTSMLFGVKQGRHIARQFFVEKSRNSQPIEKRQRTDELLPQKKTRRGTRGGKR